MDDFHASRSVVDGGTGRKFWPRRDASAIGVGNNFGCHELSVPAHIVKLTIGNMQGELDSNVLIRTRESELPARPHPLTVYFLKQ